MDLVVLISNLALESGCWFNMLGKNVGNVLPMYGMQFQLIPQLGAHRCWTRFVNRIYNQLM